MTIKVYSKISNYRYLKEMIFIEETPHQQGKNEDELSLKRSKQFPKNYNH